VSNLNSSRSRWLDRKHYLRPVSFLHNEIVYTFNFTTEQQTSELNYQAKYVLLGYSAVQFAGRFTFRRNNSLLSSGYYNKPHANDASVRVFLVLPFDAEDEGHMFRLQVGSSEIHGTATHKTAIFIMTVAGTLIARARERRTLRLANN
jgi:hypothetical protein